MRVSSKGRENSPDRPDPGCCMPGRVHHGVLSAGSRRWDPGWSPVWRWWPGHGHRPGVAAPVAGERDRDRSGRSPRRSRRRRRRLLGQGPARQVHCCGPQPALRQRDSVVPGSGDSDGGQRAQHEGGRPVPDELTSVSPHTNAAPLLAANWLPVAAGRQGGALRRRWPCVSGGLSLGRPAHRAPGHAPHVTRLRLAHMAGRRDPGSAIFFSSGLSSSRSPRRPALRAVTP